VLAAVGTDDTRRHAAQRRVDSFMRYVPDHDDEVGFARAHAARDAEFVLIERSRDLVYAESPRRCAILF